MEQRYDFVTLDQPVDEEERRTKERRLFMYSVDALIAAEAVERVYVMFTEFDVALKACDRIYQLSRKLETPQGALVTGPPGASKTTLGTYFAKSLPESSLFENGYGAILIRLRANPTQGLVVSLLLRAVKYPFVDVRKSRVYTMRDIAFEAILARGTKIVFVDQGHCLSTQPRAKHGDVTETAATDTLRELMDQAKVGLVILADSSFRGLESVDAALADRISVRLSLTHFQEDGHWLAFLRSFASKVTIIDCSVIASDPCANLTYVATVGNRRSFRRLITESVLICVNSQAAILTIEHLRLAWERTRGTASAMNNPYGK